MNALLNIGMERPDGPMLTSHEIGHVLDHFNVADLKHVVALPQHDGDKLMYVVHVHHWDKDKAMQVSKALGQDCIAQYDLDECEGALIGPKADKWGEFDPQFFKLL